MTQAERRERDEQIENLRVSIDELSRKDFKTADEWRDMTNLTVIYCSYMVDDLKEVIQNLKKDLSEVVK